LLSQLHFVSFDGNGKITQIRQSWDQGALLKQLDIIGRTGRNWPIRDSKDQLELIVKCLKTGENNAAGAAPAAAAAATTAAAAPKAAAPSGAAEALSGGGQADIPIRPRGNSNIVQNRDPHATLFLPEDPSVLPAPVVSPYAGTRPRQRSFTEILGDESEDEVPATLASPTAGREPIKTRERSRSPEKPIAPKIGSHKNFQPNRLFETDEGIAPPTPESTEKESAKSPEKFYRPNPKKFQHFDFADGSAPEDAPKPGAPMEETKGKHSHSWGFGDFETPAKPAPPRALPRAQDVRHWGNEDDDVSETPARKVAPPKPRRDAEAHFELIDDGQKTDQPGNARPARGTGHNKGLGLYENHLFSEDGSATSDPSARALGNITNLKNRDRTFGQHFDNADESPQQRPAGDAQGAQSTGNHKVGDDRMKVVRGMESSWAAYDESPVAQKENNKPVGADGNGDGSYDKRQGIAIAGDGMGNKKGSNGRGWSIGDDSDDDQSSKTALGGRGAKKQSAAQMSSLWDA
jgi:hypothetical protein